MNGALLNLWKYLLAWIWRCGHTDEEEADVNGDLRRGGLWLVVSCNRAAPDASLFLKGRQACRVERWCTFIVDDQHGLRLIKLVVSRFLAGFGSSY